MSMKVRGAVLHSRKAFVHEHFGEDAWEQVLSTLDDTDRDVLGGVIVHVGWYPFDVGERLDKAIVEVLGRGKSRIFEEIGAQSANENLKTIHSTFLRPGDPHGFMNQANTIYRFYYNEGSRTYEKTGPNSGVMTTHEAETFSAVDCLTVIGWYRTALEMCGARNVRIEETQCRSKGDPVCQYRFSWEM